MYIIPTMMSTNFICI